MSIAQAVSPSRVSQDDRLRYGVFLIWLALVIVQVYYHALWRDEARALSFAVSGGNLREMIDNARGDGHPLLWFLLLRALHDVFQTNIVLPILNTAVAAVAVALFLAYSPFNILLQVLFVFSAACFTEYPVVARNYGISVLLLFAFVTLYTRPNRRPYFMAATLFLLANTSVVAALLVPLLVFVWAADMLLSIQSHSAQDIRRNATAWAISLLGFVVCVASVYPTANDLAVGYSDHDWSILEVLKNVFLLPGAVFDFLFPSLKQYVPSTIQVFASSLALYLVVIGLVARPVVFVAALAALWGMGLFFAVIYGGHFRHQVLLIIFIVALYWIALSPAATASLRSIPAWVLRTGAYIVLPAILLTQDAIAARDFYRNVRVPFSMSRSVAALLSNSPALKDAIIVAEPDHYLEPLAYYGSNRTYFVREDRFGTTVWFTRHAKADVSLSDILDTATRLQRQYGQPVVILMNPELVDSDTEVRVTEVYGRTFRYNKAQLAEFRAATDLVASLRGSTTSEDYDVYVLKPQSEPPQR